MQHLRSNLHLRMRQFRMAGVLRIRNQLETVIHKYFQVCGVLLLGLTCLQCLELK